MKLIKAIIAFILFITIVMIMVAISIPFILFSLILSRGKELDNLKDFTSSLEDSFTAWID